MCAGDPKGSEVASETRLSEGGGRWGWRGDHALGEEGLGRRGKGQFPAPSCPLLIFLLEPRAFWPQGRV